MDEAEKYYNKALDLQPDFSRAYHLFMMDSIYLKQYQTVLNYAKIAINHYIYYSFETVSR